MKMYHSVKDETVVAQVIKEVGDRVHLDVHGEDGERIITKSTLHRWWRAFEVDEVVKETAASKEVKPTVRTKVKPEVKVEETTTNSQLVRETFKNNEYTDVHNNFYDFFEKMQEELNVEIYKTNTKGFYYLKTMGRIYFPFTMSPKKGVVLWVKSKAVEGICEYEKVNHNFDGRITISDWGVETYKLLVKLHDKSLEYTRNKVSNK